MSLKQNKKVGKESSPKTKMPKKISLPSEQLTRLSVVAKHTLNILKQTSGHLDKIVQKEQKNIVQQYCPVVDQQKDWVIQALTQIHAISSMLKAVEGYAQWELFEKIEPPLS